MWGSLRTPSWAEGRKSLLPLFLLVTGLTACGGAAEGAPAASGPQATSLQVLAPSAAGFSTGTAPDGAVPLTAPAFPRSAITAQELAVVIIEGSALSESTARTYQRLRGIPEANLIRVRLPMGSQLVSEEDFALARAQFEAKVPRQVQATVLAFAQPSRVVGRSCTMSITSAMAFGYGAQWCGGCARTQASPYFNTDTTRPWDDLGVRPSMMLPAGTLAEAEAWIARGVAADGTAPRATGWLVRTADAARSVRYPDMEMLANAWSGVAGMAVRYIDASQAPLPVADDGVAGLLFYFTGATQVPDIHSHRWLPGAVADHLTSYGGMLPDANGQMPATEWLAAGATASYGSVEEPCNHVEKFPQPSVLMAHYLRGATVIEAYWKSVAWPGQGLFIGEPLARPYAQTSETGIDSSGALWLRTRALRWGGVYEVQWQRKPGDAWSALASLQGGVPTPVAVAVPLPAAWGRLRWLGPCPTDASTQCAIAEGA